jgi:hypothetical protein
MSSQSLAMSHAPALSSGGQKLPGTVHEDRQRRPPAAGTLMLWRHVPQHTEFLPGIVGLEPPTFVFHPFQAEPSTGVIDLTQFRFAYQAAAAAFAPSQSYTSVTLSETADATGPTYVLNTSGLFNLYSIGWAARAGAVTFNP